MTTTLDGLWVLQVLCGIEVVASELGLRPHLARFESKQTALAHPSAHELIEAGVINADGDVDAAVAEWLTVLSRRDIALLIQARTPNPAAPSDRVLLARFAHWWVALERAGDRIRISDAGRAISEEAAANLLGVQVDRLCGDSPAARMRPATIPVEGLLCAVHDDQSLRRFLVEQRLDAGQIRALTIAADVGRSAQASIVAVQSDAGRPRISMDVVAIIDTPDGRLAVEHIQTGSGRWMVVSPGSRKSIADSLQRMLRRLTADENWFIHRKVV